ncbi:MAG: DUF4255 domain-containing protein [Ktedonobacteraceae bacterium]
MSNSLAIATVTATLLKLITDTTKHLNLQQSIDITSLPPDKARNSNAGNQINIFLYQTMVNGSWRNRDIPNQVRPGESGMPPLALNLYYMVTAYGADGKDADVLGHILLGRAMSVLYDYPVLGATEIEDATVAFLPANSDSGLQHQIDRVRITLQPMSLEEMSKLWMMFQTQYRLSAAYEVEVVLIDSSLPVRTPLPVLKRGRDGKGAIVLADVIPFPTLFSVRLKQQPQRPPARPGDVAAPNVPSTPTARLGDVLVFNGHHLDGISGQGNTPFVRFTNLRLGFTREIAPDTGATANEIQVTLPDNDQVNLSNPSNFAAGFYTVAVVFRSQDNAGKADPTGIVVGETNELALSLVPQIKTINPNTAPKGDVALNITCNPAVQVGQRVSLLFSGQEILFAPQPPITLPTEQLTFVARSAAPGTYFLRLRVDGVDSLLVDPAVDPIVTPPVFDPNMKVTITP